MREGKAARASARIGGEALARTAERERVLGLIEARRALIVPCSQPELALAATLDDLARAVREGG